MDRGVGDRKLAHRRQWSRAGGSRERLAWFLARRRGMRGRGARGRVDSTSAATDASECGRSSCPLRRASSRRAAKTAALSPFHPTAATSRSRPRPPTAGACSGCGPSTRARREGRYPGTEGATFPFWSPDSRYWRSSRTENSRRWISRARRPSRSATLRTGAAVPGAGTASFCSHPTRERKFSRCRPPAASPRP